MSGLEARGRLPGEPVAIVDIGSNSVRLVAYEALSRALTPIFNEKVLCGLGRGVATTGFLTEDATAKALAALQRFRVLCRTMGIANLRAVATAAVLVTATALLFGWPTPFLYWIGPQLLAQPILRAYLLAEHTGCTLDRNGLTNTRTTLTTAPVRLLMWNMPYHAEHHLFPSIPFHRLAEAHAAIRDRLGFVQPGYLRWNIALVKNLSRFAGESLPPGA